MRKYYLHILLIILGTILYFMANFLRISIPGTIFETLQNNLSLTASETTAFGAYFMYAYAISLLISGILIDKFGGIKVILFGGLIFALGALIFPMSSNLWVLYFARICLGAGSATFYLGLVQEIKKCFPDRYLSVLVSVVLFIGYFGGVCANAPLSLVIEHHSWRTIFGILGYFTLFVALLFGLAKIFLPSPPKRENVHFNLEPFREVLTNKNNLNMFAFTAINYGLCYVVQTVIGVKFLQDFAQMTHNEASLILSCMIIIIGISGVIMSIINKNTGACIIFLKIISIISMIVFFGITIFILCNLRTPIVSIFIFLLAITAGISPILANFIYSTNKPEIRSCAMSVMNSIFFFAIGTLGAVSGFILDLFKTTTNTQGHTVYGSNSYLALFSLFAFLTIFEVYFAFKLKEKV